MTDVGSDWGAFARATAGRGLRPLLAEALGFLPGAPGRALDLGCGAGNDTLALLEGGWTVTALDGSAEALAVLRARAEAHAARLTLIEGPFTAVPDGPFELVYASLSLPFCPPRHWAASWAAARGALAPGGVLAATLFGVRDDWMGTPDMTFPTVEELRACLTGLETPVWREEERVVPLALGGEKRAHLFTVIARRPP